MAEFLRKNGLVVDYSEKTDYSDYSDEMIWNSLQNRIKGSSVTLLILSEDLVLERKGEAGYGFKNSGWVYREISASLRDWENNRINGVVAVAPDDFYDKITYNGGNCISCGLNHTNYNNDKLNEILLENRFNVKSKFKKSTCAYDKLDDSYISIVKMSDFIENPKIYLDNAYEKRNRQINNKEFEIKYDFHN